MDGWTSHRIINVELFYVGEIFICSLSLHQHSKCPETIILWNNINNIKSLKGQIFTIFWEDYYKECSALLFCAFC